MDFKKRYTEVLAPVDGIGSIDADLFSRHACPLEGAVNLLWLSTKQVGVGISHLKPLTRRVVQHLLPSISCCLHIKTVLSTQRHEQCTQCPS